MSKTYEKSNEALAILAQRGCEVVREKARDLLLRRNEGLIYDKALTYWNYVIGSDIDRSLTLDDLVQLSRIKFCEALAAFDPLHGAKLTTFMTAVLNNFMIDTIRPGLKEKEAIGGEFHWLDHYEGSEDQLTFLEKYIDPYEKKPEPILLGNAGALRPQRNQSRRLGAAVLHAFQRKLHRDPAQSRGIAKAGRESLCSVLCCTAHRR